MGERVKLSDAKQSIGDAFNAAVTLAHSLSHDEVANVVDTRERVFAFLEQVEADATKFSRAERVLRMAYRKHHLGDESIGWDELSDEIETVLCEIMSDEKFQSWAEDPKCHS